MYARAPLALAVLVASQAVRVALLISSYRKRSWFSFLFLIVFLSGLMVIFTYVSSLASNEFLPVLLPVGAVALTLTLLLGIYFYSCLPFLPKRAVSFCSTWALSLTSITAERIHKVYSEETCALSSIMIIYLLIALIAVVKRASYYIGPLRSFN